jgi:PPM family protein phosphatase
MADSKVPSDSTSVSDTGASEGVVADAVDAAFEKAFDAAFEPAAKAAIARSSTSSNTESTAAGSSAGTSNPPPSKGSPNAPGSNPSEAPPELTAESAPGPSDASAEGEPVAAVKAPIEEALVDRDKTKGPLDLKVQLFARSDVGQVREHNEDNFLVSDLTRRSRGLLEANRFSQIGMHGSLFAVCDGMGGAAAGEVASQLAVDTLFDAMVSTLDDSAPLSRDGVARQLVHAVELAGSRIYEEARADRSRKGMGTTATAAALVDDHLFLAQVGDSRGYILREGTLVQVTRDQSLVNQLIEAGQLTEEEAESFEHSNIILQALGTNETVQVDLTYVELQRGDRLLLCSDGLSGLLRNDEIRELMQHIADPFELCKALTDRANLAGGHDNITVVVATFEGNDLPSKSAEELRYRKYIFPDTAISVTVPIAGGPRSSTGARTLPSGAVVNSIHPSSGPSSAPAEDAIELPGSTVPGWLAILLILAVIGVLVLSGLVLLK